MNLYGSIDQIYSGTVAKLLLTKDIYFSSEN